MSVVGQGELGRNSARLRGAANSLSTSPGVCPGHRPVQLVSLSGVCGGLGHLMFLLLRDGRAGRESPGPAVRFRLRDRLLDRDAGGGRTGGEGDRCLFGQLAAVDGEHADIGGTALVHVHQSAVLADESVNGHNATLVT